MKHAIDRKTQFCKASEKTKEGAIELIDLAQIYFLDGAPATAAKRLREAADKFDHFARIKEAFLRGDDEVPE